MTTSKTQICSSCPQAPWSSCTVSVGRANTRWAVLPSKGDRASTKFQLEAVLIIIEHSHCHLHKTLRPPLFKTNQLSLQYMYLVAARAIMKSNYWTIWKLIDLNLDRTAMQKLQDWQLKTLKINNLNYVPIFSFFASIKPKYSEKYAYFCLISIKLQ